MSGEMSLVISHWLGPFNIGGRRVLQIDNITGQISDSLSPAIRLNKNPMT